VVLVVDSFGIETLVTVMTYLTFTTPAILAEAPSEPVVTELQDSSILYLPDPFKGHVESRLLLDTFQASLKANLPGPEAFALTFTAFEQPLVHDKKRRRMPRSAVSRALRFDQASLLSLFATPLLIRARIR